jgi:hypothetical protein
MSNPDLPGNLKSLPEALRDLPQLAPQASSWPQLAAQLREAGLAKSEPPPQRRARRWFVPAALAAGIALAAVALPLLHHAARAPAPAVATVSTPAASISTNAANSTNATSTRSATGADAATELASLQQHSQALEHWLRETERVAAPLRGQDLAAAAELEDMIGLVDGQLNAAPPDSELPLWRCRVALLEDLTALRYSSYKLAETGVALR